MKNSKRHIIYTWIVLLSFLAGQWAVYAHQHKTTSRIYSTHQSSHNQQTITEKCQLCDAMHHNSMVNHSVSYFTPVVVTDHFYKKGQYNFVSIALILSAGRSPPLS